jgi:DNA-binding MarR family transcriptional regulator
MSFGGKPPSPNTPTGLARAELGTAFRKAEQNVRILRGRDGHLQAGEVGHSRFELLALLLDEQPISAGGLAEASGFSSAAISKMLDPLVADGYVRRTRSETDRRVVVVELTDKGRDTAELRIDFWTERWNSALKGVKIGDLEVATDVLERIASVFVD